MSNTLTTVRTGLAEILTDAGLTALYYLPERLQPPVAIVSPDLPYLERGETFGTHRIGLRVLLIAPTATNEVAIDDLDDMVTRLAVAVFNAAGYQLQQVDEPGALSVNNAVYLSCNAHVTITGLLEVA